MSDHDDKRRRIIEDAEKRDAERLRGYAEAARQGTSNRARDHLLARARQAELRDLGKGSFHRVYGTPLKWT